MAATLGIALALGLLTLPAVLPAQACAPWPDGGRTLQAAVNASPCVQVAPGTHILADQVILPPGHALYGSGRDATVLVADQATFPRDGRAVVTAGWAARGAVRTVGDLTIDAAHVAMQGAGFFDLTLGRVRIRNAVCAGVTIAGPDTIIHDAIIEDNAWPTYVGPLGKRIDCTQNPGGGNVWGAGVYLPPQTIAPKPVLSRVTIRRNHGPGIDAWGAAGGYVTESTITDNTGWAAVHLYQGASDWTLADSTITQPISGGYYPHRWCYTSWLRGAAVRACDRVRNLTVARGRLSSYYAALAAVASSGRLYGVQITGRVVGFTR